MTHTPPTDIRAYLEIRTAAPSGWSPDARRLLVCSTCPGRAQVHRLDLEDDYLPSRRTPRPVDPVRRADRCRLPAGRSATAATTTAASRHRHRRQRTAPVVHRVAAPDAPYAGPNDLDPLVVDPEYIHRPGGVTRDGPRLAYATNRGTGSRSTPGSATCPRQERRVRHRWLDRSRWVLTRRPFPRRHRGHDPAGRQPGVSRRPPGAALRGALTAEHPGWSNCCPTTTSNRPPSGRPPGCRTRPPSCCPPTWARPRAPWRAGSATWTTHGSRWISTRSWRPAGRPAERSTGRGRPARHLERGRISRAELRDPRTLEVPGRSRCRATAWPAATASPAMAATCVLVLVADGARRRVDPRHGRRTCQRATVSPNEVDDELFVDAELVRFPSFDGLEVPAFVHRPRRAPGGVPLPWSWSSTAARSRSTARPSTR